MEFIADLHIHSKYSRATSPQMNVKDLAWSARSKGITLLGTGDFTHPLWLLELKKNLRPSETNPGLYEHEGINFMLSAEVSAIFYVDGRAHQIHNIIFAPSFEAAEKINLELEKYGSLGSDGRPMLHIEAEKFVKSVLSVDKECMVIPGHVWTPHFGLFGSQSGFDKIEYCYKDQTKNIHALETGLSSDPAMNWRWSALDRFTLISNSDSHSPAKMGREANVFNCKLSYFEITGVLRKKDKNRFSYTIEFFPEEGKYHFDGHRNCNIRFSPKETKKHNGICPVCKKPVVVGVLNRVDKLSDRPEGFVPENAIPFKSLIPLQEIIAEAMNKGVATKGVEEEYKACVQRFGGEFEILLKMKEEDLRKNLAEKVAEAVIRVRNGKVNIKPGFDGEYGTIEIFGEQEKQKAGQAQMTLF